MRIVAIIQARMGSSRLPGKVLMDLAGEPMLARVVNRLRRAETIDAVLVATTIEPADDVIAQLCEVRGWPCFRGSHDDVLDRYYQAAKRHAADVVVRITSDCPLIEPAIIDRVIRMLLEAGTAAEYACNFLPQRTFPRGLDTEAFAFTVLETIWREDDNPAWREHVTEYLMRHPERFRVCGVIDDIDRSHFRWTVDTPEDLEFVRRVYAHFGGDRFSWTDVLGLLELNPSWLDINRHVEQKVVL